MHTTYSMRPACALLVALLMIYALAGCSEPPPPDLGQLADNARPEPDLEPAAAQARLRAFAVRHSAWAGDTD